MQKSILQLTNVNKHFLVGDQTTPVLKNINLTIQSGTMVAIVGASGSGKSTLMNILGCLDRPSSGIYTVNGRDTGQLDSDELAKLRCSFFGFVFQRYHLLPNLSALENVEIPAIYAGVSGSERQANAIKLLTSLGLGDRIDYRPNQLSGGQQQRISIARALSNGGSVILADEPTGALDSETGEEMMQLLLDLRTHGHTVVIVTHDNQVAAHADRIIEIRDGEIINDHLNENKQIRLSQNEDTPNLSIIAKPHSPYDGLKRLIEAFHMARSALATQCLRTALTMLGIIIGIASVVSIMAIGEGGKQYVRKTIGPLTANKIDIRRGIGWGDGQATKIRTLLPGDVDSLRQQSYIEHVSPLTQANFTIRFSNADTKATVTGVNESFFNLRGINLSEGRALSQQDIQRQSQVVVIDQETRQKLFKADTSVGKVIIVGIVPCTVIGVTSAKSKEFFPASGPNLFLPYTTAGVRLFGYQNFDSISVRIREGQNSTLAEENMTTLLTRRHGSKDFFTNNMDTLAKAYEKSTRSISLMLTLIASIALAVGGIGVMNIMLVSVTERTREIGIRMAVGARRSDIMKQFLVEAVVICLIGGTIGILLSLMSGSVFSNFIKEWKMIFTTNTFILAFIFSSLIGIAFGFLPARRASLLHPHDALSRD